MSVVFHAEDEPVASRRDYWQDLMHELLTPLDLRLPEGDFRSRVEAHQLGAAQVFQLDITEGEALRTPRLIKRSDPELCKVDVLVDGDLVVEQDDRQAALRPGDMVFVDLSRPCRWINTAPVENIAVSFPRRMLPLRDAELRELTGTVLPGDHGVAGLVSSLARQLPSTLRGSRSADGMRLGSAVLDLLATVLAGRAGATTPVEPGREALLTRIRVFIEARLGDPRLSAPMIADAHHISVRQLYKVFETEQVSVAGWIWQRRLERCRRDLLDPVLRNRPAGAIGARWGFANPSHFNRAFRRAYGLPPGEYRRYGQAQPAEQVDV
jgi:AraC-like DNA-binding protein